MKEIAHYTFYKTKYGDELLIDLVTLDGIGKYIRQHPVHTLSYYDITLITDTGENTAAFSLDGRPYRLAPGDMLFSRPGEIRAWEGEKLPGGYALIFEEEFLRSFFNDPSFLPHLSFFRHDRPCARLHSGRLYPRILGLMGQIAAEINDEETKDNHMLRALLYETLTLLNREYARSNLSAGEMPPRRHIDRFIRAVDTDFAASHDTKHYADLLCITPNYLNEIVQRHLGTTAKGYIQQKIVTEAKTRLAYTGLSVSEVAGRLGFENPSYFIRLFRRQTGLTPLQYRRELKQR